MGWTEKDLSRWQSFNPDKGSLGGGNPKTKQARPRMNKWEESYDADLRAMWGASLIQWYGFEAVKLRLAGGTHYTPDFAVIKLSGDLEFIEVKGFWRDDALVKFKVAAEQFPFKFVAMRKKKASAGGGWETIREIDGARINGVTR